MKTTVYGIAAILGLLATGACSKDPEVAKREYVRSGDQYVAQKKYKEAVIEYRNAVQQDPRFGEARLKLAETYDQLGEGINAYGEYIRAADLLPNDVQAQLKAARMLLLARQYEDAQSRADKALAVDPRNVEALVAKGNALAGLQNLDAAIGEMEEAIRQDPARSDSYANLGAIQLAQGKRSEAEASFKRAIETDPKSLTARLALANYYWNSAKPEEVERALLDALALDPKHATTNRALAVFYVATNRAPQAEPFLKTLVANSNYTKDTLLLADYYVGFKRHDEAKRLLQDLAKKPDGLSTANVRLASMALAAGDRAGAHKLIDEVITKQPRDVEALVAKAKLLLDEKKYDEALVPARAAIKVDPRVLDAQFTLGKIQVGRQDLPSAIAAFTEVLKINPQLNAARFELARIHLVSRQPDEAIAFAQEGLKSQPNDAQMILILNRAQMMKGDVGGAEARTRKFAASYPKSPVAQTQLGQLLAIKGDAVGARRAFDQALALNPNEMEALGGLVALDFQANNGAAARARIDARVGADTKDPQLLLLAARVYATTGDTGATERTLRKVIDLDPTQLDAYVMLGQFYASQRRLDEARAEFERVAAKRPSAAVGAQTLIGMLLQMQGKDAEARTTYEKVIGTDPRAAVAANNLAWLYVEQGGNLDVALRLAQTAKSQLTDRPEVNDTLGWVYYKKGLAELAIPPLLESVGKAPKHPMYQYHLGLAYVKTGDVANGRKALETALALDPKFQGADDAQRVLATLKS
jgi:tetratricopeptide (TPR) repeat protein